VHYLVEVRCDAFRAMGLLAKVGIQNIVAHDDDPTKQVTARLSADDRASASTASVPPSTAASRSATFGRRARRTMQALSAALYVFAYILAVVDGTMAERALKLKPPGRAGLSLLP
jgi:hypothetical protein